MTTVLTDYLSAQRAALHAGLERLRAGDRGAVHPTRVATRRLRSSLRSFAPAFPERRRLLGDELAWFAGVLGEVRDREVLQDTLAAHADDPLAAELLALVRAEEDIAWATVVPQLDSHRLDRLLTLTDEVLAQVVEPPLAETRSRAAHALGRFHRRLERARQRGTGADADLEAWHDARKAGKRARYAAEVVAQGQDKPAVVLRLEELQDVLGEHQDLVVADAVVERLVDPPRGDRLRAAMARRRSELEQAAVVVAERAVAPDH